MMLDFIMVIIVLVPVCLLVLFKRRKELKTKLSRVICQIAGAFMLVFGVLLLFPAFYVMFQGKTTKQNVMLLVVSLSLVFSGYMVANWADRKPDGGTGHEKDDSR